jgi:hypothetical protein
MSGGFAAIDNLAGVQLLSDAYEVYVDCMRLQTNIGVGRVQAAVSVARVSEGFDGARKGRAKVLPRRSQAA